MTFASGYVRVPELFPARNAGEMWGKETLTIDLPGGPYLFRGLARDQADAMRDRYEGCLTDVAPDSAVVTILYRVDRSEFLPVDTRGWEYTLDLAPSLTILRMAGMNLMARLTLSPRVSAGVWTSESEGGHFIGVIENVFRPLVAYRLLSMGGLVLHSSGVVIDGEGVLFAGRSGAGKSTVARLAIESGREILSDDLNLLIPGERGWQVSRLPFAGEYPGEGREGELRLRAVYRLEKGDVHAVHDQSAARSFAQLIECAPYVNVDPGLTAVLEGVIERLVDEVPFACLTFRPDSGLWPIIEAR